MSVDIVLFSSQCKHIPCRRFDVECLEPQTWPTGGGSSQYSIDRSGFAPFRGIPNSLIRKDGMVMVTTVSDPTPEKQTPAVGKGGRVLPEQSVRAAPHGGLRGCTGEGGRRQNSDRRLLWRRAVLSLGQPFVRGVRWNRDQPSCGGLRHA